MAIINTNSSVADFLSKSSDDTPNTFASEDNNSKSQREPAKFFVNIGFEYEYVDEEGNPQNTFITLPTTSGALTGIILDNLKHQVLPTKKNANMRNITAAKNAFLDKLMKIAQETPAGESTLLSTNIRVEIRHASEKSTELSDDEDNPISIPDLI